MSTPIDLIYLEKKLKDYVPHSRVLYVGIREKHSLALVRAMFTDVATLDNDPKLKPDYLVDLNSLKPISGTWDLIVMPYVAMYLKFPIGTISNLCKHCDRFILQDNVIRSRPDNDPWPDLNRFTCLAATYELRQRARAAAFVDNKTLLTLNHVLSQEYYDNPPGVSAIWEIKW